MIFPQNLVIRSSGLRGELHFAPRSKSVPPALGEWQRLELSGNAIIFSQNLVIRSNELRGELHFAPRSKLVPPVPSEWQPPRIIRKCDDLLAKLGDPLK